MTFVGIYVALFWPDISQTVIGFIVITSDTMELCVPFFVPSPPKTHNKSEMTRKGPLSRMDVSSEFRQLDWNFKPEYRRQHRRAVVECACLCC